MQQTCCREISNQVHHQLGRQDFAEGYKKHCSSWRNRGFSRQGQEFLPQPAGRRAWCTAPGIQLHMVALQNPTLQLAPKICVM